MDRTPGTADGARTAKTARAAGTAGAAGTADERERLLARYRELVLQELPRRGRAEGWAVSVDHCVGRVVLDNALGGPWRDVLPPGRGAAFTRLPAPALARAVALAERMDAEGAPLVAELDGCSLAWRGKPAKRRPAAPRT